MFYFSNDIEVAISFCLDLDAFSPRVAGEKFESLFVIGWLKYDVLTGVESHDSDQRVGDHIY